MLKLMPKKVKEIRSFFRVCFKIRAQLIIVASTLSS
jgi:hypothetical protein